MPLDLVRIFDSSSSFEIENFEIETYYQNEPQWLTQEVINLKYRIKHI